MRIHRAATAGSGPPVRFPHTGAILLFLTATLASAQVSFEVATIREAKPDNHHSTNSDNGRFTTRNVTLKSLIARAYDVDLRQILGGPDWIDSTGFDINAKIPDEFSESRRQKLPLMVQSLLAERFQLKIHRQPEEIPGYALIVAKKGIKISPAKSGNGNSTNVNDRHLTATNTTMESFAKALSRNLDVGKLVIDKTGLSGGFDFELTWAPDSDPASDLPSIFTALEERLGLKLEPAKIPVQAIVIDHAEKPGAN